MTDHEVPQSKFVEEFQVEDSKCSLPGREERETNWPHVEKHLAKAMDEVEQSSTECQDNKTHHSGHKEGPTPRISGFDPMAPGSTSGVGSTRNATT